jgi:hypothetical protein
MMEPDHLNFSFSVESESVIIFSAIYSVVDSARDENFDRERSYRDR